MNPRSLLARTAALAFALVISHSSFVLSDPPTVTVGSVTLSGAGTLTNKTISLGGNTVTFTASGTGGMAVNVTSILQTNEVLPEMFGAVGDGTTDDSAAFQAAFNAGWSIVGKARTTYVVKNLAMKFHHQGIRGLGQTVLKVTDATADAIDVPGNYATVDPLGGGTCNGNYVKDLILLGPGTYTSGSFSGSSGYGVRAGRLSTVTISIASPGVVTWTGHNLTSGTAVIFSTTGALPTGLTAGTTYYVIAAGLTSNTFEVSATLGGSAINTSGSQSGNHRCAAQMFAGDGLTASNLHIYQFDTAWNENGFANQTMSALDFEHNNHGFVAGAATGNSTFLTGLNCSYNAIDCCQINGGIGWDIGLADVGVDAAGTCVPIQLAGGKGIVRDGNFEGISSTGPDVALAGNTNWDLVNLHIAIGSGADHSPVTAGISATGNWEVIAGGFTSPTIAKTGDEGGVTGPSAVTLKLNNNVDPAETFTLSAHEFSLDNGVLAASSTLRGQIRTAFGRASANVGDVPYFYGNDSTNTAQRISLLPTSLLGIGGTFNADVAISGHNLTIAESSGSMPSLTHGLILGTSGWKLFADPLIGGDFGFIYNGTKARLTVDGANNRTHIGFNTDNTAPTGSSTLNVYGSENVTGALTLGTALAVAQGGTGATTAQTALDALSGTIHQGDILYDNGTHIVRLTPGTSGQFLKTQGGSMNPVWATASGGGISDPNVGYVRSNGNDSTGDGSPGNPYLTAQAALTSGFHALDLGVGNFGNITVPATTYVTIRGRGQTYTTLGAVTFAGSGGLFDLGNRSVLLASITIPAAATAQLEDITLTGNITASDSGGGSTGATVFINSGSLISGNVDASSNGGTGGSVNVVRSTVTGTVTVSGNGGTDGSVNVSQGEIDGALTPDAATVLGAIIGGGFHATSYP